MITAIVMSIACVCAKAEPVTLSQAKSIAAAYIKSADAPRLIKRKAAVAETEVQPLYVFSRGVGEGFVLVSGDDALPAVIGYTETGDFDEDNLPPALQDMIAYYTGQAESLQTKGNAPRRAPRKASGTKDIATLMTSHWHQTWPYYNLCPYLTGTTNHAVTGCVATAASQIIYYWRKDLDDRTKYGTPTYGYGDAPVTQSIPSGTPLKWDLMRDSYSGSEPEECTTAVATLLACVGASAWLTYGSSTSGQIDNCRQVFSGQMGLNGGATVWKGSYSQTSWEKMIIQDLEAGRPILYSGVHPSNGGHAVVIDGYQLKNNLFHFNFGWGGGNGYDGYYTVDDATGMNGFNESQGMVWNIYPKTPNLTGKLSVPGSRLLSRFANKITAKITNNGTLAQKGFYLYCLTGANAVPNSSSSAQDSDTKTLIEPGENAELEFSFTPSGTNTYTIYLCDANHNILAKVSDVETEASVADLTLKKLTIDDGGESESLTLDGVTYDVKHIFNSKKVDVTATFTNGQNGTKCSPSVQAVIYKLENGEFVKSTTKTKKNVPFNVGETADMVFDLTSLTDGETYKFALAGTASTNKSFDINYATNDTALYFKLMGPNLSLTTSEDGQEAKVTGNYNSAVFASLSTDSTVNRYDMTEVKGLAAPLTAANKNALFYADAAQQVAGRNIITDQVCEQLDLTPGYNFLPREDFKALSATYHATQAVGMYGTAVLPFDAITPTGMFARKVNLIKSNYLQEVDSCNLEMKGGTPYIILTGEPVDVTAKAVMVSINTPSLSTDTIRGTWVNLVATENNKIPDNAETQYFDECTGTVIPALTAYLEYDRKVRLNSYAYSMKDKKARQLAEAIAEALVTYNLYERVSSTESKKTFLAVLSEARETLRTQPVTAEQTAQINALEAAATTYVANAAVRAENGYVDKTAYIANPSFEQANTKGWTATGASIRNITGSLTNYMGRADGRYVVNIPKDKHVEQTLTGVENGKYQLVVSVAAELENHITVFAGTDSVTVESTDFGPMYMADAVVDDIEVTDGTLTIGALSVEDWAKVDNFRLYQKEGPSTTVEDIVIADTWRINPVVGTFDLSGRRVSSQNLPRGIYIRDGKKIVR